MGMQREDRKTARMYRDGAKGMHAGLISLHNLCGAPPFTVRTWVSVTQKFWGHQWIYICLKKLHQIGEQ